MAEERSGYKHNASDKKLDHAADAAKEAAATTDAAHGSGPGHDVDKIRKHDDAGKDRLFEGREQRDDAERKSEKNRLARDAAKHDHPVGEDAEDEGTGPKAKPAS